MTEDKPSQSSELSLPQVETIYPVASNISPLNAEIKALIADNPALAEKFLLTVLDGMKEDQRIRADRQKAELELKNKREDRKTAEFKAQQGITKLIIGAISLAFAGSLGLAFVNKDSSLADKVFTGAMGVLAGSGGAIALSRRQDKNSNSKDSE